MSELPFPKRPDPSMPDPRLGRPVWLPAFARSGLARLGSLRRSWRVGLSPAQLFGETCLLCGRTASGFCAECRADLVIRESVRRRCPGCAEPIPARSGADALCIRCQTDPPWFDAAVCGADYAVPVDAVDRALKFQRRLAGARLLGLLLVDALLLAGDRRPDLLVAVPLAPARLAERGYNQALLIARVVARELDIPLATRCLVRVRSTSPLAGLGASARRDAIRDAFGPGRRTGVAGLTVGLVDDVMTTGATLDAAAEVLHRLGAGRVIAMPALRTPAPC
jgi:ComF family protein